MTEVNIKFGDTVEVALKDIRLEDILEPKSTAEMIEEEKIKEN
jgi:hypothetical protein